MGPAFIDSTQSSSGAFPRAGGGNRRRFMRVHPSVLATRVATRDLSQVGILVENISLGGVFLRTDKPLPLGEPLSLEMARPGHGSLVRLQGRVVSTLRQERALAADRPPGMGVSFTGLDEVTRESLKALLRSFVPVGTALETPLASPIKVTVAVPEPVSEISQDVSGPVPMAPPSAPRRDDSGFFKAQVKSLVQQMAELHEQLNARANEIDGLHTAIERLQQENGALRRRLEGRE